ncbi:MAG: hypothetical protein JWO37_1745 [Acidimicrobiales bacterium]|jgi:hypothetical protein|nr:hypothetical protein [Acidimicrobiales bacterium]
MTRTRATPEALEAQAVDAAVAALQAADIEVDEATDHDHVKARVDGRPLSITVVAVSYCTGQRARELVERQQARAGGVNLLVADRVTAEAKAVLSDAGWSWLDRRGQLHLRGPGVRVDLEVEGINAGTTAHTDPPIAGRSGITIAYWLCEHPGESLSPTRSAPQLRLAPSTISTSVRRLADAGLVDDDGAGVFPELFWELADAWPVERTWLISAPDPANHTSPDPRAPRWRRTGTAAAAAYGAPVVSTAGGPIELYVAGPVEVSVAVRRHGRAEPGTGAAAIAVAPVSEVVAGPADDDAPVLDGWLAAPVLAVALDLAQDRARGREILSDWSIDDAVWK